MAFPCLLLDAGGSRRSLAMSGIKDPNTNVDIITSERTDVTIASYSVKTAKALIARPNAIAPLIIPA